MERFPTWRVWRLIHTYPAHDMYLLLRVLRVKPHRTAVAAFHNPWWWGMANMIVSAATCYNLIAFRLSVSGIIWTNALILSLFITFNSLRFAFTTVSSISKLREMGNYDLLVLLPVGELATGLNISRTHRFPLEGTMRHMSSMLIVLVIGISFCLSYSVSRGGFGFWAPLLIWLLLAGLLRVVDYLQSFVLATLIALLASQHQNRSKAQAWVIGSFLIWQIVLYLGLNPLLSNIPSVWQGIGFWSRPYDSPYLWWHIMITPLFFVLCRELINLALWRIVQRRLAD